MRKQLALSNTSIITNFDRSFVVPLSIQFITTIYANITTSEWCIARYEKENTWKCISSLTAESPGVYQGTITSTGKFVVMHQVEEEAQPILSVIQRSRVGKDTLVF